MVKKVCRDSTGIVRSGRNGVRKKGKPQHFAVQATSTAKQEEVAKPPPTVQVSLKERNCQFSKKRRRPPPLAILHLHNPGSDKIPARRIKDTAEGHQPLLLPSGPAPCSLLPGDGGDAVGPDLWPDLLAVHAKRKFCEELCFLFEAK